MRRDAAGNVAETPREMFVRVARTVAGAESNYGAKPADVEQWAQRFYAAMAGGLFLPNSPTLMNAGRVNAILSVCFVLPIEDSIEGIFESVKHTAQIQKAGGGTGFSFDRLRPTGDYISSSGGKTSGPMSFWRVFSEATRAIQPGAFRRGANMGMMSIEHPDILKFITAKTELSVFENFNISIKVGQAFARRVARCPTCHLAQVRRHACASPKRRDWRRHGTRSDHGVGVVRHVVRCGAGVARADAGGVSGIH